MAASKTNLAAALLACSAWLVAGPAATAQDLNAATASAPPEGVAQGQGAANPKGHYAELDSLPDWGGIWFLQRGKAGASDADPVLTGEYKQRYEDWLAGARENQGVVTRNRSNCSPPGLPRIMRLAQYPYEFIFAPGRVTINQEAWMQTRTIWTDGRKHQEDPDPSYMGDSIGHWEGDTLVVDTIGILDALEIEAGIYHSPEFHLIERIHLSPDDPDVLINEMRMEDPEAFAEPFEATATYRRDRYGMLYEFQCSENDRNPIDEDGHTVFN